LAFRLNWHPSTARHALSLPAALPIYPIGTARNSNMRWRPVGLGLMGLQDVFFRLRLPFDSEPARELSTRIQETIYFHALRTSVEDRKSTRLNSSHVKTSYAGFCLKKK